MTVTDKQPSLTLNDIYAQIIPPLVSKSERLSAELGHSILGNDPPIKYLTAMLNIMEELQRWRAAYPEESFYEEA